MTYTSAIVFYPHGVLFGIDEELSGYGWDDGGGRDVAEARA